MYEVGIKKKNAFINYINALHFFKRKIGGGGGCIKICLLFFFFLNQKYKREGGFLKGQGAAPPAIPPATSYKHFCNPLISYNRKWIIATGSCGHRLINFSQHFLFVKMSE